MSRCSRSVKRPKEERHAALLGHTEIGDGAERRLRGLRGGVQRHKKLKLPSKWITSFQFYSLCLSMVHRLLKIFSRFCSWKMRLWILKWDALSYSLLPLSLKHKSPNLAQSVKLIEMSQSSLLKALPVTYVG